MFDKLKNMVGGKGFRQPKKLNKEQQARQIQAKAFGEEYEALCVKHKLQLVPLIKRETNGAQYPDLMLAPYEPPQMKNWADASEENLAVAKACRHLNENNVNCKTCAVRIADQDPSGTGVTAEYIKAKEERIAAYRAKTEEKPEVL